MLTVADRRGIDELEVWSWPISRVMLWAKYYAKKDKEASKGVEDWGDA